MNIQRLRAVVVKEFRQLLRDKQAMRVAVVAPIFQLVMFGFAATMDLKDARLAVCDRDGGQSAREFVDSLEHHSAFTVHYVGGDPRVLPHELDTGRAQLALDIPPDFGRKLARGRAVTIQLLVDGADSNTAQTAVGYLLVAVRRFNRDIALDFANRQRRTRQPEIDAETRVWYNPDLKSRNYMVPGIVGMILLVVTTNFTALSVVRERETGTLEQVVVTPLRPFELLLGKMIPIAVIGLCDAVLIVLVSIFLFRTPLRGSLLLLFAMACGFLLYTLGTGLLISTVSRTQQQAQMVNFFLTMPAVLLSGFVYPVANMPEWAQALSYLTPMRYFVIIVRGIYLKGNDLDILWPQGVALAVLGSLIFLTGVLLFRKRVD